MASILETTLPRLRHATRLGLATALIAAAGSTHIAWAEPANPSDEEIRQAESDIDAGAATVSSLVATIATLQRQRDDLDLELGARREEANKATVDAHDAQTAAEMARQDAAAAKEELNRRQSDMEKAQEGLDEISRASYRQSLTDTASTLSGERNSEDGLDRQTHLRVVSDKQAAAIEKLDRARTAAANQESVLREKRNIAEERERIALEAEETARHAYRTSEEQVSQLSSQRDAVAAELESAEDELESARENAEDLLQQREEYREFERAEAERKAAEEAAQRAAEEAAKAQAEASRSAVEATETPDAGSAELTEEPQSDGVKEAQQAAREAQDSLTEAQRRESEAAAEFVASIQPEHNTLENPYPTDEDAAAVEVAEIQNPNGIEGLTEEEDDATATEEPEHTSGADHTGASTSSSTAGAESSAAASGSRAEQIEIVINRAMSQLGQPYAWGGGTAQGPSQGIRDGGVADSYGDYNKIGFDCSGLVLYAFAGVGISLPHYSGYQYQHGTKVDPSNMQRGDLLFYGPGGSSHVAIYLGDGQMIEAPQSGSFVQISPVRWTGMSEYVVRLI